MTVVDVNTGKFTGSGGNLEETVTKNNLEAAEEIVRQLRLRDIGGIIVIDFIDMVLESNRDLVLRRMVECLGRDRTRHQVAEVTSLGLVQMTRKRIGTGLLEAFSEDCDHCKGRGLLVHDHPIEPSTKLDDDARRGGRRGRSGGGGGGGGGDRRGGGRSGGNGNGGSGGNNRRQQRGRQRPLLGPVTPRRRRDGPRARREAPGRRARPGLRGRRVRRHARAGLRADAGATRAAAGHRHGRRAGALHARARADTRADTRDRAGGRDGAEPTPEPEPEAPAQPAEPAAPTVVTSTRRRSARRAAGPAGQRTAAEPSGAATGDASEHQGTTRRPTSPRVTPTSTAPSCSTCRSSARDPASGDRLPF